MMLHRKLVILKTMYVKSVVMYEKKEDGTRKQIRGYELLKRK